MLLHCDFVVAGTDAVFSTPFVGLGLIPEAGSTLIAPRLMGHRRAFEFLVMGHPLNATRARDLGIANLVVDPHDVDAEALKAARALMRGKPEEVQSHIDQESRIFSERLRSPEAKAAFEAFFARKR